MKTYNYTYGGLGNILFQIATGFAYSLEHNKDYCISPFLYENSLHGNIENYFSDILSKFEIDNNRDFNDYTIYKEQSFNYAKIPFYATNVILQGYFQSEKYFKDYREDLLRVLDLDQNIQENNKCSIHVRRGDYLKLDQFHPTLSLDYYYEAMSFIKSNEFVIFSDDIDWCKKNFKGEKFVFSEGNSPLCDLINMSKCNNNIIANSSFSWWASWLNTNPNKKVITPKKWFGSAYSAYSTDDLFYSGMIQI